MTTLTCLRVVGLTTNQTDYWCLGHQALERLHLPKELFSTGYIKQRKSSKSLNLCFLSGCEMCVNYRPCQIFWRLPNCYQLMAWFQSRACTSTFNRTKKKFFWSWMAMMSTSVQNALLSVTSGRVVCLEIVPSLSQRGRKGQMNWQNAVTWNARLMGLSVVFNLESLQESFWTMKKMLLSLRDIWRKKALEKLQKYHFFWWCCAYFGRNKVKKDTSNHEPASTCISFRCCWITWLQKNHMQRNFGK